MTTTKTPARQRSRQRRILNVAGASGYLMKNVNGDTLVTVTRNVLNGRVALSLVSTVCLRQRANSVKPLIGVLPRPFSRWLSHVEPTADCAEVIAKAKVE